MRTVPNMYILSLAISHMIYLTALFLETCANKISDTCLDGDFMCTFLPFCYGFSVGLSEYSLAVLSIQRHNVAVNLLNFRTSSLPTLRLSVATICVVWIVAALFALSSVLSKHRCKKYHVYSCITYYRTFVIFEFLVSCELPVYLTALSYIMTARHLTKSALRLSEDPQNTQTNKRKNNSRYK
jgi:ABC-type Fe3+ transport system permease subunit